MPTSSGVGPYGEHRHQLRAGSPSDRASLLAYPSCNCWCGYHQRIETARETPGTRRPGGPTRTNWRQTTAGPGRWRWMKSQPGVESRGRHRPGFRGRRPRFLDRADRADLGGARGCRRRSPGGGPAPWLDVTLRAAVPPDWARASPPGCGWRSHQQRPGSGAELQEAHLLPWSAARVVRRTSRPGLRSPEEHQYPLRPGADERTTLVGYCGSVRATAVNAEYQRTV